MEVQDHSDTSHCCVSAHFSLCVRDEMDGCPNFVTTFMLAQDRTDHENSVPEDLPLDRLQWSVAQLLNVTLDAALHLADEQVLDLRIACVRSASEQYQRPLAFQNPDPEGRPQQRSHQHRCSSSRRGSSTLPSGHEAA